MTAQELILLGVVAVVGIPSAWRNPTAAALVASYVFVQVVYLLTGDGLAVEYLLLPDIAVIGVIFAKPCWRDMSPYGDDLYQLKCMWLEISPADRAVMLMFPAIWAAYVAPVSPYSQWHLLWAAAILQFLFASAESIEKHRSRSVSGSEAELGCDPPAERNRLVEIQKRAGNSVLPPKNDGVPALAAVIPMDASFSARVIGSPFRVPLIGAAATVSQITDAVIRWVAVDVVDAVCRPFTKLYRPDNAVRARKVTVDGGDLVAVGVIRRERLLAGVLSIPRPVESGALEHAARPHPPKQPSRLRLIAEKFAKRFRGRYFSDSHGEASFRGGQGRAVLEAPPRPAFSSTNPPILQLCAAECAFDSAAGGGGDG